MINLCNSILKTYNFSNGLHKIFKFKFVQRPSISQLNFYRYGIDHLCYKTMFYKKGKMICFSLLNFTCTTAYLAPHSLSPLTPTPLLTKKPLIFFLILSSTNGECLIFFTFKLGCIIFVLFLQSGIS